jgi:class 3 adenylate cyclase
MSHDEARMSGFALVVDNDGVWRDSLARAVNRVGLKCDSASTPQLAIELIRKKRYVIALLDADLGTEQGPYGCSEILSEIKARGPEIPIIIVSGLAEVQALSRKLARHYSRLGDFSKGDNLLELERLIRDLLGGGASVGGAHAVDLSDLVEDVTYDFGFLKIDVVGHSSIYSNNRSPAIDETLDAFERMVEDQALKNQGYILSWQGDGGLIVFIVGDKVMNCSETALSLLYSLRKFNDNHNKTESELRLRMACHLGTAKYKSSHGRIHSPAINFVCHLEAKGTPVNAISVSEIFYKEIPTKVQARFSESGEFEGVKIYAHRLA